MMSMLETIGQAQVLQAEGSRLVAAALAEALGTLARRVSRFLGKALSHVPSEHLNG